LNSFIFGHSPLGLPILGYSFGQGTKKVLIMGGVHGDEVEGIWTALRLLQDFSENYEFDFTTILVPMFNPEGALAKTRQNSRGVDLNRNLPTRDWSPVIANPRYHPGASAMSEPENSALMSWLEQNSPRFVLSLHSWQPCLNINGLCEDQAKAMAKVNNYKITTDIGYPTPGSLGSLGTERQIPVLTYEIERGLSAEKVLEIHPAACLAGLRSL
jgi:protein MpaA